MKRPFPDRPFRGLVILTFAGLVIIWTTEAVGDRYKVANMTETMKSVCVGRMVIQLPHEAKVELNQAFIQGFDITAFEESLDAFNKRVAEREAQLRATPDRLGGAKNLELVKQVKTDNGLMGKIFVHGRVVTEGDAYNALGEEHYRYENVALEGLVHADGLSIDFSAEAYDPDKAGNLVRLIGQLVPNRANRVPAESGFCINQAYFRDPLVASQRERVTMYASLPSHPDIAIKFDTAAGTKPDKMGLLERNARTHSRMPVASSMRFTKLRGAARTIDGLTGDELVEQVIEENFAVIYGFRWEVNGTEDNVLLPRLSLMMATGRSAGGPVPSSLAQGAALALWDKISSTIRLRPTVDPKVSATKENDAPLGTNAFAGDTCPRSGWWQCNDGGNGIRVHGGQRQYVREGQPMPQALLLPPQTFWERIRGLQPSFESRTRTAWQLVDKRSRRRVAPGVTLDQAKPGPTGILPGVDLDRLGLQASAGVYGLTGNPCPASGWWQCQESDALDGTRWFAKGSLLPAATFSVSARVMGRSTGTSMAIQRRGTWRLARLAEAPALDDDLGADRVSSGDGEASPESDSGGSGA